MSQSLYQIYVHLIFSTKYREPIIDEAIENELHSYLAGTCKALECQPIKVGGYYDHIHILCKLSKKIALMQLLEDVKKSSSKWIKSVNEKYAHFYWQSGYAAFSVSPKDVDKVINYIAHQKEHHQKQSFQDECRLFFKKYKIDYDERYVWD
ncbi:MAG TPA: IS200/IS605 family transposase [Hanamia sp.]